MERFLLRSLSAVVLLFLFGIVNAAYIDCSAEITGLVDGSVGCTISEDTYDYYSTEPMTVNTEGGFFGIDDWNYLGKDKNNEGSLGTSGQWAFSDNFWDLYDSVMLVFRGYSQTTLVGYLLDGQSDSGGWDSPFVPSVFGLPFVMDVAHISYYGAGDAATDPDSDTPVSEPQTVLLLGLGLFGLAYSRKRVML
jgi:hypothetical protein